MPSITGFISVSYIYGPIRHPSGEIYAVRLASGDWYTSATRLLEEPGAGTRCHVAYDDKMTGAVSDQALGGVKILSLVEPTNLFTGLLETLDS